MLIGRSPENARNEPGEFHPSNGDIG
jgi:hypothetical protein